MNSNDWVAEHVMGFERGNCHGNWGGGSMGSDGTYETWFYCDWCGRLVDYGKTGPCPKYPFPKFTLVDLMRKLGERGDYAMIRYDALRPEHNFTITVNMVRIADTDHPLRALSNYLYFGHKCLFPEIREKAEPVFFANIRDAIKLLQKAMGQEER